MKNICHWSFGTPCTKNIRYYPSNPFFRPNGTSPTRCLSKKESLSHYSPYSLHPVEHMFDCMETFQELGNPFALRSIETIITRVLNFNEPIPQGIWTLGDLLDPFDQQTSIHHPSIYNPETSLVFWPDQYPPFRYMIFIITLCTLPKEIRSNNIHFRVHILGKDVESHCVQRKTTQARIS